MISFKKYSLLLDYLKGKLPKKEHDQIAKEIEQNPELQEGMEDMKLLEKAFIDYKLLNIEHIAEQSYEDYQKRSRFKKWLFSSLILMGVGITLAVLDIDRTEAPASTSSHQDVVQPVPEAPELVEMPETAQETPQVITPRQPSPKKTPATAQPIPDTTPTQEPAPQLNVPAISPVPEASAVPEKEVLVFKKDPCIRHQVELSLNIEKTCKGKNNGAVAITAEGGQAPYSYAVYNESKTKKLALNNLTEGLYTATATDNNGCYSELVFEVQSKLCPQDYEFNPGIGQTINFGVSKGTLKVHTPAGEVYFEKSIQGPAPFEWDGKSSKGTVKPGYYIFNIDQNGQQLKFGSITITE